MFLPDSYTRLVGLRPLGQPPPSGGLYVDDVPGLNEVQLTAALPAGEGAESLSAFWQSAQQAAWHRLQNAAAHWFAPRVSFRRPLLTSPAWFGLLRADVGPLGMAWQGWHLRLQPDRAQALELSAVEAYATVEGPLDICLLRRADGRLLHEATHSLTPGWNRLPLVGEWPLDEDHAELLLLVRSAVVGLYPRSLSPAGLHSWRARPVGVERLPGAAPLVTRAEQTPGLRWQGQTGGSVAAVLATQAAPLASVWQLALAVECLHALRHSPRLNEHTRLEPERLHQRQTELEQEFQQALGNQLAALNLPHSPALADVRQFRRVNALP